MKNSYDIHPDYQKLPRMTLSFKGWIVALLNFIMAFTRLFGREKSELTLHKESISRSDGSALRIIRMVPPEPTTPMPCLLYYHGGGFALTYGSPHINMCQRYASEAGCTVVFVEYRLMPKHPFPAGADDCHLALEWVLDNAERLGIDPTRIAVGGDSAGGALSASVSQMSLDRCTAKLCAQMLIYPVTDRDCKTRSATEFTDTPIFNSVANRRMWDAYLCNYPADECPAYASPIHRENFTGLPPAYVETAEFDPLHDEGLAYAEQLIGAGVSVELNDTKGTVHGYDAAAKSALGEAAIGRRVAYLKAAFVRA
jgi:acetyl esterase